MEERTVDRQARGLTRAVYLALGLMFTGLGIIGAFVPLMPTTIFLILAVACFTRSSQRLEAWILGHARFGPPIRRWRDHGAISPQAKMLAVGGMAAGLIVFWVSVRPGLPLMAAATAIIGACAAFVLSRPSGPRANPGG